MAELIDTSGHQRFFFVPGRMASKLKSYNNCLPLTNECEDVLPALVQVKVLH
jgi:hypothetical protein